MFSLYLSSRRQHTRNRHRNMRLCRPRDNWPVFNRTGLCLDIMYWYIVSDNEFTFRFMSLFNFQKV